MQAALTDAYAGDYLNGTKVDIFIDKVNRAMVLQVSRTLLTLLTSTRETSDPSELRALLSARIPSRYTDRALSDTHSDLKTIKQAYKKTKRILSEFVLPPKCQDTWVIVSTTMDAMLGKMPPNFNLDYLAHLTDSMLFQAERLLSAAQTVRFLNSDADAPSESVEAADTFLLSDINRLTPLATEAVEIMRLVIETNVIMRARKEARSSDRNS